MDQLTDLIIKDESLHKYYPAFVSDNYHPTDLLKTLANKRNNQGQTPLYLAFQKANINLVIILMNVGAKCYVRNSDGSTPYMGFCKSDANKEKLQLFKTNIIRNMSDIHKSAKRLYLENNTLKIESYAKGQAKNPFTTSMIHQDVAIFKNLDKTKGAYLFDHSDGMLQCYDLNNFTSREKGTLGEDVYSTTCTFLFQSKLILEMIGSNLISAKNVNVPLIYCGNIATAIANPENKNHYFVLPSQLNGAEYPSHDHIIETIDQYIYDQTGGPIGQLSVHTGIGQFILDNAANKNKPYGINGVKYLSDNEIKSVNGYLKVSPNITKERVVQFKNDINKLIIVGMENCLVKNHNVHLIYASAVPINCYVNPYSNQNLVEIANTILVGEYFGAMQIALLKGQELGIRQCIHLMPLGGGVFRNSSTDIMQSILTAIANLEAKYGVATVTHFLDVRLLCYERSNEKVIYLDILKKLN